MRTAPAAFVSALSAELTFIVRLCKITTLDGKKFLLTDSDTPIVYEGDTYYTSEGFEASALAIEANGGLQSVSLNFALDPNLGENKSERRISRLDVDTGYLDAGKVELYAKNLLINNATSSVTKLYEGVVEEVTYTDQNAVQVECGSKFRRLRIMIDKFSPTCRADFCDPKCGLKVENYKLPFITTALSTAGNLQIDTLTPTKDEYKFGLIVFETGINQGRAFEIASSEGNTFIPFLPFPKVPNEGDTGYLVKGCDKTLAACKTFKNVLNFQGEPFPPLPMASGGEDPVKDGVNLQSTTAPPGAAA